MIVTTTAISVDELQHSRPADLNLWYGDFQALKNIDASTFAQACITALIGPSGCGKTTLAALLQPHQRALRQRADDRRDLDPRQEHLRRRCVARRAAKDGRHGVSAAQSAADFDL